MSATAYSRLSELDRDLLAAWAAELLLPDTAPEDEADRLASQTVTILERIVAVPAKTFAELRVKARAVKIVRAGEELDDADLESRLLASMIADLCPEQANSFVDTSV